MTQGATGSGSLRRIRGGRGLGDAIYTRAVVDYYAQAGERLAVLTDYPDVYLGTGAKVLPFQRIRTELVAHYVGRKYQPGTTQWQDVCASAGLPLSAPFRVAWPRRTSELVRSVRERARGRPVVLVHGGRTPMQRSDGFGIELLPRREAFETVLEALKGCYTVQIGKAAQQIYPVRCALDLNGRTTPADLLDLAQDCDGVVAQCSFAVPLAEVFDRPLLAVWGARINASREQFVRATTPQKVLSGAKDVFVMDDWDAALLREVGEAFVRAVERGAQMQLEAA